MINIITANLAVIGAALVGSQINSIAAYYNIWDYLISKFGIILGFFSLPLVIWSFTSGPILFLVYQFPVGDDIKILTLIPSIVFSLIIIYLPNIAFLLYPCP